NRRKLAQLYLEDELERINGAGVKLAREAREVAGREVFIAGSIGPLGDAQGLSPEQRAAIFAEQAEILDGRGVDLFMIETFYELDELETAIAAARSVSGLPIVATLTFDEGAETLAGGTAAEAAARLRPPGPSPRPSARPARQRPSRARRSTCSSASCPSRSSARGRTRPSSPASSARASGSRASSSTRRRAAPTTRCSASRER